MDIERAIKEREKKRTLGPYLQFLKPWATRTHYRSLVAKSLKIEDDGPKINYYLLNRNPLTSSPWKQEKKKEDVNRFL